MHDYREVAPPREVAGVVDCLWVQQDGPDGHDQRVIPDGCSDVIWAHDQLIVAGPATAAVVVPVAPATTTVGIRFRPGAAASVLGLPAHALRDQVVAIDDVWPADAARLSDALADGPDVRALVRTLLADLGERLRRAEPDPLVAAGADVLGRPGARVGDLPAEIGISERQLRRRFHDAVGYGPKTLDRVLRLHRFLAVVEQPEAPNSLAVAAAEAGYADQAHLGNDCVRLTGLAPGALLAERAASTDGSPIRRERSSM